MYLPIKNIILCINIFITLVLIIIGSALHNIYVLLAGIVISIIGFLICIFMKDDPLPDELPRRSKTIINVEQPINENNDNILDIV